MDMEFCSGICGKMKEAEREAARLLRYANNIVGENKSGSRDVVTEYDRRIQKLLESRMLEEIPGAQFFCEELGEQGGLQAEHLFIIDPIDGTMNFVKGFNHSCISMAYAEKGEICAAAVYNPYADEMFTAVKGMGAFLNDRPISVSSSGLSDSIVCFGSSPYRTELADRTFALARRCFDASLDVRREGSAELDLCSVAAGRAGLYFELSVSFWDYAAGWLIVKEAGGICLTAEGRELPFDGSKTSIAAGNEQTVREFLTLKEG